MTKLRSTSIIMDTVRLEIHFSVCVIFYVYTCSSSGQSFSSGEESSDSEFVDHDYNNHTFAAKKVINKGRWSTEEVIITYYGKDKNGSTIILQIKDKYF